MGRFKRFGNMNPCKQAQEHPYLLSIEPFRIVGNVYYVGTAQCSSILIDSGDGLILLDTPNFVDFGVLVDNITRLGFKLRDIKHIIVSHAHMDHYGCVAPLVHLTGAKVYLGETDANDMKQNLDWFQNHMRNASGGYNDVFDVDVKLKDGDIIEIGNVKIRCVETPGHTIGCMSHFWETEEDGKTYRVGIYGGAGFSALTEERLEKMGLPLTMRDVFAQSIDKVFDEKVDVMLGNHPFHNDTFDKYDRRVAGEEGNPFIDPTEWQRYLNELRHDYAEFLALPEDQKMKLFETSGFMEYMGKRLGLSAD